MRNWRAAPGNGAVALTAELLCAPRSFGEAMPRECALPGWDGRLRPRLGRGSRAETSLGAWTRSGRAEPAKQRPDVMALSASSDGMRARISHQSPLARSSRQSHLAMATPAAHRTRMPKAPTKIGCARGECSTLAHLARSPTASGGARVRNMIVVRVRIRVRVRTHARVGVGETRRHLVVYVCHQIAKHMQHLLVGRPCARAELPSCESGQRKRVRARA